FVEVRERAVAAGMPVAEMAAVDGKVAFAVVGKQGLDVDAVRERGEEGDDFDDRAGLVLARERIAGRGCEGEHFVRARVDGDERAFVVAEGGEGGALHACVERGGDALVEADAFRLEQRGEWLKIRILRERMAVAVVDEGIDAAAALERGGAVFGDVIGGGRLGGMAGGGYQEANEPSS